MKTSKRKTRSDKFPLTLHPTGQYCKESKRCCQAFIDGLATSLHFLQRRIPFVQSLYIVCFLK